MIIYDDKGYMTGRAIDPFRWDRPPRVGRSKYKLEKMDKFYRDKVTPDGAIALTITELILRVLPLTPDGYFRGSHLRYYERDLRARLFEERLRIG